MMKANIEVEIFPEDISYALKEVIEDATRETLNQMIRDAAQDMVKKEIEKILEPLVLKTLTDEKFNFIGYHGYADKRNLDERIRNYIVSYLDQPCFIYSKSSNKPSERLHKSSGSRGESSRLEYFMCFAIQKYFDEHIESKMAELVDKFILDRDELEKIAKEQMSALLREKIK